MSRLDKYTERWERKEIHGQVVNVRILKPYKLEVRAELRKRRRKTKYCNFCETEIFDSTENTCELCGRVL